MRPPPRLDRIEAALAESLDAAKPWLLAALSIVYLVPAGVLAVRRVLWNDELYTYHISRLPSLSEVWAALLTGGEQLPPFFYVITRASIAAFGTGAFALRLPEVLGFWLMGLCLFYFVCNRTSAVYGLVAALFPLVTSAYYYAHEARPYGLLLGFGSAALLAWQSAGEGRRRKLSLVLLVLSLGAAVSCHYYGVLIAVPLALGELTRTLVRRRMDWAVWAAFALAATPLLIVSPLIVRARANSGIFWALPRWISIPDFYSNLLAAAALPLVALVLLAVLQRASSQSGPDETRRGPSPWRPHEIAAAVGFAALPVFGVVLAKFVTHAFTDRYVITAVIGLSVLLALAAHGLMAGRAVWGGMLAICLCGWFGLTALRTLGALTTASEPMQAVEFLKAQGELPIVISDAHTAVELSYYAPPDVASRMVYLADPEASLRHLGFDSVDRGMLDLVRPWFHVNVEQYKPYMAERRPFLMYGNLGWLSWLHPELKREDVQIELIDRRGDRFLFLVTPRGSQAATGADASAGPAGGGDEPRSRDESYRGIGSTRGNGLRPMIQTVVTLQGCIRNADSFNQPDRLSTGAPPV